MTRLELNCLYNIIMLKRGEISGKLTEFVYKTCNSLSLIENERDTRIMELFLFAAIVISKAKTDWDEANRYSKLLILMELKNKRSAFLYHVFNEKVYIYNKLEQEGKEVQNEIRQNRFFVKAFRNMMKEDEGAFNLDKKDNRS